MPVSLKIVPLFDSIDLLGRPDSSSAYSLAGHISLSLSSRRSLWQSPRPERLRLESLEVTFEGHSELLSDATGYSAVRLCNITRELIHDEPVLLTTEDSATSTRKNPSEWEIVFDIPVPGWLPTSSDFGDSFNGCTARTQYALYAKAQVRDLDSESSHSFLSLLCGCLRPPTVCVSAPRQIVTLNRFYTAPTIQDLESQYPSIWPSLTYGVATRVVRPTNIEDERDTIPLDVLRAIDVTVDVPEHLSVTENLPVMLRTRLAPGLDGIHKDRVKFMGFKVEVMQNESYVSEPCPNYVSHFPLPPASQQPPNMPLLSPHSFQQLLDLGILGGPPETATRLSRDTSLLPPNESPRLYRVANNGATLNNEDWSTFKVSLDLGHAREMSKGSRDKVIRPTGDSPLFKTRHQLLVELECSYEHPVQQDDVDQEPKVATETLHFAVPLHFVIPTLPLSTRPTPPQSPSASSTQLPLTDPYSKQTMKIPAYSQLFYPNGDPREDSWEADGEQLPVYSKDTDDETAPLLSS